LSACIALASASQQTIRANLWDNIFPQNGCECLKEKYNVTSLTLRVFDGQFLCSPVLNVDTIQEAKKAGMDTINGWVFPSPNCDVKKSYQSFYEFFLHLSLWLDEVWLDIGGENVWNADPKENIKYIHALVDEGKDLNYVVGIKTNDDLWKKITGDTTEFKDIPLWFAKQDAQGNMTDFKPFGGWTTPTVKSFKSYQEICGGHYAGLDYHYKP